MRSIALLALFATVFLLSACSKKEPVLQEILNSGELRVMTLNAPTTFYQGPEGPAGLEYELIKRFTKFLGVKPRFILPDSFNEVLPAVINGDVHLAAAGLTVTEKRLQQIRFSTPYQTIHSQVVYLSGMKRPQKNEDLVNKKIRVIAGSSHEELLENIKKDLPALNWKGVSNTTLELLMQKIIDKKIDYVIADSNEIAINRRYFPKISIGYNISEPEQLAWALPHSRDNSLYDKTIEFFEQLKASGQLELLLERYYGHVDRLNFVDKRTFWRHTKERLPQLQVFFQQAAKKTGYDWRLLAAIGYQESHWDPEAVSPTGVKGIMMLTSSTARQMKINNRSDPEESIMGGARYLKRVEKKIPSRIREPDRLWFALAGYNVGFGHLEDARILTQRHGENPDKWLHVKKYLPELSKPEVYKTLKHGYARGQEPVNYVDNIRNYYDLLLWKEKNQREKNKLKSKISIPSVL